MERGKNQNMGQDAVVGCHGSQVVHYWNTAVPHYSWPLDDSTTGLSEMDIQVADGKIYCSFLRDSVTRLDLPGLLGDVTIDLDKESYYLELATGPLSADDHVAHHSDRGVSAQPFRFNSMSI